MSIILVLWLLGVSGAVAMLLGITKTQRFKRAGSEAAAALLIATYPFCFIVFADFPLMVLAATTQAWLLVLPARLIFGRLEQLFLIHSTQRNALTGLVVLVVLAGLTLWRPTHLAQFIFAIVLTLSIAAGFFFFGQLWWNTRRYRIAQPTAKLPLKSMPTVSVCIPARNEDHALGDCLTAVLASDYPKLEVLVLDDCSQDTTSSIIKSFAHDGVRFIQGDAPATGWLGKNQARQTLAQQASGDYLLFLDVDTHLSPHSISSMVRYVAESRLQMVGVLPQNRLGLSLATFFGTLDYFWRLVLPISSKRIPVSSNCWLIAAASLQRLGGFASVSRKILPEESFARRLAATKAYRFVVSDAALGVTAAKRWSSQIDTSIRLSYPLVKRQPMANLFACLALLGFGISPFAVMAYGLFFALPPVVLWLAVAASLLFWGNYWYVLMRVQPSNWLLAGLLWPLVAVQALVIFVLSMLQYEFGEVNWKGRNVCYSVLAKQRPVYPRPFLRPPQS